MPTDVYRPRADAPRMPAAYKIEGDSNTVQTRIRTRPVEIIGRGRRGKAKHLSNLKRLC